MTTTEQIRLLISDPAGLTQHYTDTEIAEFYTLGGNSVFLAAALALKAWAASISANADSEKIGDYSYSKKEADTKLKIAENYENQAAMGVALDWAEMDLTSIGELEELVP